ncbi:hypothetical protein M758_10G088800 [Ceratodon purpureus]|nr:hypothetical protein M758_10G088800 [Ceratodon purpureus]
MPPSRRWCCCCCVAAADSSPYPSFLSAPPTFISGLGQVRSTVAVLNALLHCCASVVFRVLGEIFEASLVGSPRGRLFGSYDVRVKLLSVRRGMSDREMGEKNRGDVDLKSAFGQ